MKKYVKFTEGRGVDLTPNKAYEVMSYNIVGNPEILTDCGYLIGVLEPGWGKSSHTNSEWQWCDENGKEVTNVL